MVRYGITGFGLHAAKRLVPGFARAQRSTVTALARRNEEKARADAERFAIAKWYLTAEELAADPKVQVVFVSSPNSLHMSDVLAAVNGGKHVLCEKPMAMNAAEAEKMVQSAKSRGVLLGVAQCMRFHHSVQRMRELVQSGALGEIVSMRSDFTFSALNSPRKWLGNAALAGGGAVADIGVHTLDTMRYVLGDEIVSVRAELQRDEHSGDVEASATMQFEFGRGAKGESFVSFRKDYSTPIEIVGTMGSVVARDALLVDHPVQVEWTVDGFTTRETFDNSDTYARQVDAFSEWVEGGAAFCVPGEEGVKNQRVLDAVYQSGESGEKVTVLS